MARVSKIVKCVDCGREFPRKELNRMCRCRSCATEAIMSSMTQLHNKAGPYYDKWKEAMQNAARRL